MPSDELRATIARVRHQSHEWNDLDIEEKTALLDAAERAQDARNAALEEAAKVAESVETIEYAANLIRVLKEK